MSSTEIRENHAHALRALWASGLAFDLAALAAGYRRWGLQSEADSLCREGRKYSAEAAFDRIRGEAVAALAGPGSSD